MAFTVTIKDKEVMDVLAELSKRMRSLQPVMRAIGDDIVERAKARFDTSTGPDGVQWAPNSATTLDFWSQMLGGKSSYVKKDGSLNKAGQKAQANKRPLVGESGDLRRQIVATATETSATIQATMVYAAIQQFGGVTSANSMIPGKTIPARPFLPITENGDLYPQEQVMVLDALSEFLMMDL